MQPLRRCQPLRRMPIPNQKFATSRHSPMVARGKASLDSREREKPLRAEEGEGQKQGVCQQGGEEQDRRQCQMSSWCQEPLELRLDGTATVVPPEKTAGGCLREGGAVSNSVQVMESLVRRDMWTGRFQASRRRVEVSPEFLLLYRPVKHPRPMRCRRRAPLRGVSSHQLHRALKPLRGEWMTHRHVSLGLKEAFSLDIVGKSVRELGSF